VLTDTSTRTEAQHEALAMVYAHAGIDLRYFNTSEDVCIIRKPCKQRVRLCRDDFVMPGVDDLEKIKARPYMQAFDDILRQLTRLPRITCLAIAHVSLFRNDFALTKRNPGFFGPHTWDMFLKQFLNVAIDTEEMHTIRLRVQGWDFYLCRRCDGVGRERMKCRNCDWNGGDEISMLLDSFDLF